jgi:predicted small lipoprotein YifL
VYQARVGAPLYSVPGNSAGLSKTENIMYTLRILTAGLAVATLTTLAACGDDTVEPVDVPAAAVPHKANPQPHQPPADHCGRRLGDRC